MATPTLHPRVWMINQWLPPDPAPTAVLCGEVLTMLADAGYPCVWLSRQRGDAGSRPGPGVEHIVTDRLAHGPMGLFAKLMSWPGFAWRALRGLRLALRAGDVVIVCSDPPLFYPLVVGVARRAGARVIHWSQDVYPDVVQSHWQRRWMALALAPLRGWRNARLRRIDRVVTISPGMQTLMRAAGARTALIPNWARDDRLQARALGDSALRRAHYRDQDFVLAYSGNLGRVHEFATLLGAARLLKDDPHIHFLIVGNGPRLADLRAAADRDGLRAFRFLPLQPEAQLTDTLAAGDLHYVSLRPEFEGLVLPSKLYSIAAVGRGVLFCGDISGETAQLLSRHACGAAVAIDAAAVLAERLRALAADRAQCEQWGSNARRMLDGHYARAQALLQWRQLIDEVAQRSPE